MTDQVYSMSRNGNKESGHEEKNVVFPTLVRILEGFEIVQVASGHRMTIFLTSEGDVLEIGKWNESGEPFLKHKNPESIVKIVAGTYSLFALSSLGNVFSWRGNGYKQLGFPGEDVEKVSYPRMIPFFSKKGLKVEEVVGSRYNSYFLCEGGELFGAGSATDGRLGNHELKTPPETPILISRDVERGFQVQEHTTSSLQSLMRVFGLLETMAIIKEGLKEISQMIENETSRGFGLK